MTPSSTITEIPASPICPDFPANTRERIPSKAEPVAITALQSTDDSPNPHPSSGSEVSASCITLTIYAEEGSKSDTNL